MSGTKFQVGDTVRVLRDTAFRKTKGLESTITDVDPSYPFLYSLAGDDVFLYQDDDLEAIESATPIGPIEEVFTLYFEDATGDYMRHAAIWIERRYGTEAAMEYLREATKEAEMKTMRPKEAKAR